MDARLVRAAILIAASASLGANYRTPNFVVSAPTPQAAEQIGREAERFRKELAVLWLGKPLPNWSQPCPITAQIGDRMGAGGATSFMFDGGEVYGWRMSIQGSLERILDSVLPHEVTHTIFASYFRRPLPRWADEGACTTVEHPSERGKQQRALVQFLRTQRGIPFDQMFAMKEYPHDILPLYAQGHSLATYLIGIGGREKFLAFVAAGLQNERWTDAITRFYGHTDLLALQNAWLDWVKQGSPAQKSPAASSDNSQIAQSSPTRPTPGLIYRGQSEDRLVSSAGPLVPVNRARGSRPSPDRETVASATAQASSGAGWRPKGAARPAAGGVAVSTLSNASLPGPGDSASVARSSDLAPVPSQASRPQPTEQSRQVILEWSRDDSGSRAAPATLASRDEGSIGPQASVYARVPRTDTIRR